MPKASSKHVNTEHSFEGALYYYSVDPLNTPISQLWVRSQSALRSVRVIFPRRNVPQGHFVLLSCDSACIQCTSTSSVHHLGQGGWFKSLAINDRTKPSSYKPRRNLVREHNKLHVLLLKLHFKSSQFTGKQ